MCFLDEKKKMLSNLPSEDNYMLHSVSGECEPCGNCKGKIFLAHRDNEICSECCQGHEELKKLEIETDINKNIK
jgi:hypothetical protein